MHHFIDSVDRRLQWFRSAFLLRRIENGLRYIDFYRKGKKLGSTNILSRSRLDCDVIVEGQVYGVVQLTARKVT